jgi:LEA14-like dessication related protein
VNFIVTNPNGFSANLGELAYQFAIQDQQVISASHPFNVAIAANGDTKLTLPITLQFQNIYNLVKTAKSLDTLHYAVSGQARLAGVLSGLPINFTKKGNMPNFHIPQVSLGKINKKSYSLNKLDLDVTLNVANSNLFKLAFGKMDYKLNFNGVEVATGAAQKLLDVPAKGTGEMHIPITLQLSSMASIVKSIISGEKLTGSIQGGTEVQSPYSNFTLPFQAERTFSLEK